jgi:hypothetical protein
MFSVTPGPSVSEEPGVLGSAHHLSLNGFRVRAKARALE